MPQEQVDDFRRYDRAFSRNVHDHIYAILVTGTQISLDHVIRISAPKLDPSIQCMLTEHGILCRSGSREDHFIHILNPEAVVQAPLD